MGIDLVLLVCRCKIGKGFRICKLLAISFCLLVGGCQMIDSRIQVTIKRKLCWVRDYTNYFNPFRLKNIPVNGIIQNRNTITCRQ